LLYNAIFAGATKQPGNAGRGQGGSPEALLQAGQLLANLLFFATRMLLAFSPSYFFRIFFSMAA